MSISSKKVLVGVLAAAFTVASAGAFAQDRYDDRPDPRYDNRYDSRYDDRDDGAYDYAKVIDVQPLVTRVRVSTPEQECWDETRYDQGGYRGPDSRTAGGTLLGAVIGAAIGNQIGHGDGRRAATAAGAIIGAGIGNNQAQRRAGYPSAPPREYRVQRCETRYHDEWQERTDGYRVTYLYQGRRQVTELPYRPGDRIRVRVDVSPAQ
ncbi:MAG TPA: glycine zipper 2TM domain-containing protein [Steroidobacteraceae bacterium]|nr:glycine zipper 2TM domain-containing protein [Steroidobacteraceae bacterium]